MGTEWFGIIYLTGVLLWPIWEPPRCITLERSQEVTKIQAVPKKQGLSGEAASPGLVWSSSLKGRASCLVGSLLDGQTLWNKHPDSWSNASFLLLMFPFLWCVASLIPCLSPVGLLRYLSLTQVTFSNLTFVSNKGDECVHFHYFSVLLISFEYKVERMTLFKVSKGHNF